MTAPQPGAPSSASEPGAAAGFGGAVSIWRWLVAVIALAAIGVGVWRLETGAAGIEISSAVVDGAPVLVFAEVSRNAPATPPQPTVVVAHGFAGSQQLMRPIAIALARRGYRAVTFDFLGHGRNPAPLTGDVAREDGATRSLVAQLEAIIGYAKDLPGGADKIAVLGHSMAADIVVRAARADPDIAATVAVSMFSPAARANPPRNLLIVTGGYEQALRSEALNVLAADRDDAVDVVSGDGETREGVTVEIAPDDRRRAVVADGVEHIGVLYSRQTWAAAADWLDEVFERQDAPRPEPAAYGPWLLLTLLGVIVLAWPLARALPRVAAPRTPRLGWGVFLAALLIPAVATPLVLWLIQIEFLPVLVADYLAQHFALYGVLTGLCLWLLRRRPPIEDFFDDKPRRGLLALSTLLVALYGIVALGAPIDAYATSFVLTAERTGLFLALLAGTIPYFLATDWLTRRAQPQLGGYALTVIAFLGSLALAIALDLERLFFLIIIAPVMLAAFVVFGLFSRWVYRRTGSPTVAGVGNAVAIAYAIAATFPLVGG